MKISIKENKCLTFNLHSVYLFELFMLLVNCLIKVIEFLKSNKK